MTADKLKVHVVKIDKSLIESLPEFHTFKKIQGSGSVSTKILIEEGEMIVALEKVSSEQILDWSYILPEVYYVLEGKCELSYSYPPFTNWETVICEKGDVVYLPTGIRVKHKVISKEPLLILTFHFPPGNIINSIKLKKALGIS